MTEKPDEQCVASHGDFMRNLVPGSALIAVALSCAACGEAPTILTAFRTEEQAQTHCPKDMVVWLDPQSGLYYFKGSRVIWSLECRPLRLSYRSRRRGHAQDAELTRSGCCFSRQ